MVQLALHHFVDLFLVHIFVDLIFQIFKFVDLNLISDSVRYAHNQRHNNQPFVFG